MIYGAHIVAFIALVQRMGDRAFDRYRAAVWVHGV